jgi:hypothetical protein
MGGKRSTYMVLVGKPEGKIKLIKNQLDAPLF